jgi:ABC-type multidrug transport system fused ATPase/permease subunit
MASLPRIAGDGRWIGLASVTALGIAQAGALGGTAFATRSIFADMHRGQAPVQSVFVLMFAALAASAMLRVAVRLISENIGERFAAALRHRLYSHMAGMNRSDLSQRRRGILSLRFVGELQAARGWAGSGIAVGLSAGVTLAGSVIVLALLQPVFAVAAIIPVALLLPAAIVLGAILQRNHRDLRRGRSRIAASMIERIALAPELDLANRTDRELQRLDRAGHDLVSRTVSRRNAFEWLRGLPYLTTGLGATAILWLASRHQMPTAEAAAALAVLSIMSLPLADFVRVWDRYCAWRITRDSCRRLLASDSVRRVTREQGRPVPVHFDGSISGDRPLAVDIPAGSLALVCGPPASGKSSLARVLAGQDRPGGGRVCYAIEDADLPSIAFVGEDPLILKGSLRRAASLGIHPRPDPRHIRSVAKAFGLNPLLKRLGSTKAPISERGGNLSSGEQLGVGLTRAALMRPDLIIIDHPALTVNGRAEKLIGKLREMTDATVVVVAPPDALPCADQVIKLA